MKSDELALAERIEWNEDLFSANLAEAVRARHFSRCDELITTFENRARERMSAYPNPPAKIDLDTLRSARLFTSMKRYAEAVLRTGTTALNVRRQYGQALIELGAFDEAREVLESVVKDDPHQGFPDDKIERDEARGLIGRSYKQQYVIDPTGPDAANHLKHAIAAYENAYNDDPNLLWHGVNAASCIQRARRDGLPWDEKGRSRDIAAQILDALTGKKELNVWDRATRVEALLARGDAEAASAALDAYLCDPNMNAFQVSSTHRQFDEVLQLSNAENSDARSILDRLRRVVERYRAGGLTPASAEAGNRVSVLVRVSDPGWRPPLRKDVVVYCQTERIVALACGREMLSELLRDPKVVSIDESREAPSAAECDVSLPFINVTSPYPGPDGNYDERGERALIAVIDDGIDVLHEAFRDDEGKSRIVGVWDQTDRSGTPPSGFTFGTYHGADALAAYVKDGKVPLRLGRDPQGHGTHVASIAAGRQVGSFAGGVAPAAALLVVIADRTDSIGYSAAHLAALKFIDQEAMRLDRPVVVNVSQGMNAGAHDGNSALEAGFDEFAGEGRKPGRIVVKSAGNERGKFGHAAPKVGPQSQVDLPFERAEGATSPRERIELWWSSANEVEFRLQHPAGEWSTWVSRTTPSLVADFDSTRVEMRYTNRHIDNGDDHLLVMLGGDGSKIAPGVWTLQMYGKETPDDGTVHAWIERGSSQTPTVFRDYTNDDMTLSIPGTAHSVITVGAVSATTGAPISRMSSFGPTRDKRLKPEVSAPGVEIKAANGGTASGIVRMSGTSMAAPHAAGAIALALSRVAKKGKPIPTASQISKALLQKTANYNPHWDPGKGFGVIDVAKFLAAF